MAIRVSSTSECTCPSAQLEWAEHYHTCPDNEPDLTVEELRYLRTHGPLNRKS